MTEYNHLKVMQETELIIDNFQTKLNHLICRQRKRLTLDGETLPRGVFFLCQMIRLTKPIKQMNIKLPYNLATRLVPFFVYNISFQSRRFLFTQFDLYFDRESPLFPSK